MKIRNIIVFVMTSCIILSGCARNSAWRTDFNEKSISECNGKCLIEKHDGYEIGFLEFSDKGNLFDYKAKEKILNKLDDYSSKSGEGAIIVVFVHGWRHNAADDDENVKSFRAALEKISKVEQTTRRRNVFGLYIGWRGLSLHDGLGLTDYLTFWDRKSVAQEVGKGGVTEIFLELDMMSKRNVKNTLLIAGHSFGAAITLSALNEILLDRMIRMKYESTDNGPKKFITFGDGVVLLNPAIEANQIEQLFGVATEIAELTERGEIDNIEKKKLLTIITTDGDLATKYAFYAGQFLDNIFTSHSEIVRRYSTEKIGERGLEFTAVGHYIPFQTENLINSDTERLDDIVQKCTESENKPQIPSGHIPRSNLPPPEGVLGSSPGSSRDGRWRYMLCCNSSEGCPEGCIISNKEEIKTLCEERYLPISLVYTEDSFIEDHNDIFNNNVIAFLAAGATGSMMRKLRVAQEPQDSIPQQCKTTDMNKQFDFRRCFDYFLENFSGKERESN